VTAARIIAQVDGDPDVLFATLTDPARLPLWNAAVRRVIDVPVSLDGGADWVVEMHALGRTWRSRSHVVELDATARTFRYRSRTDDGNPSFTDWVWTVAPRRDGGRDVTVSWDLHPVTFWRRALFCQRRSKTDPLAPVEN
jgi:uncharacterized protein YndB with AHSA1/START domain